MAISASFARMATVTASTKRGGARVGGVSGDYAASIASLKCLPLAPVTPEVAQGIEGLSFREISQTFVEGGLDIAEGDKLVVGATEYPIRAVEDWTWPPDSADILTLFLEDKK